MQLSFLDEKHRALCERDELARTELGSDAARQLRNRLADLQAAQSPAELIAGDPQILGQGLEEKMVVRLNDAVALVLQPGTVRSPLDDNGGVAWEQVFRVHVSIVREGEEL